MALDPEWPATFRTDLTLFGEYARAVYAASDAYLAGLGASDLAFEVPKHLASLEEGKPAVRRRLVALGFDFEDMVTLHVSEHAGEISAVLGAMGLQGSAWG